MVDGDALHYVAADGEVNDVVVGSLDANTLTVRDFGATIEASNGCESIDAHQARCTSESGLTRAQVETGDGNDRVRSFDESEPISDPPLVANGGPGDDELIGGDAADSLDGGGGRDRLLGAAGPDALTDGDVSGHADADVLVGGPGVDTVVYSNRTAPVDLALGDEKTHGEHGEGDSLTTIENILSGSAGDRLTGDNYDNDIAAGAGDDILRGGLGADRLLGGRGVDSVFCGGGADVAFVDVRRDFVQRDCEQVTYQRPGVRYAARPYPRGLTFRLGCPILTASCSGRLTLRETRGRTRLIGTGKISKRSRAKAVKVKLTRAGRKLAGRRGGVLAIVTLKGKRLPSIGWTIRFRR